MRAAVRTDVGRVRESNEDCAFVDTDLGLLIVADGMGGHAAGEVASSIAMEVTTSFLRESLPNGDSKPEPIEIRSLLFQAIAQAGHAIQVRAAGDSALTGMGTTIVLALSRGGLLHIAHVGDSRAYLMREGSLRQLTSDHSVVAEMIRAGEITPKEARAHRRRNILSRCLGGESIPQVDVQAIPWSNGDCLLLCSDGLNTMVEDRKIEKMLARCRADLEHACEALVKAANSKGGKDNISVILACPE